MTSLDPPDDLPDDSGRAGLDPRESRSTSDLVAALSRAGVDFELRLGEHTPIRAGAAATERASRFRDVLGIFATGVTVVTSVWEGTPVGMTCQSFSSVSLDPPLVMFCPAVTSRAWPLMQRAGFFCVNVLSADQRELADGMATKGQQKFADVAWEPASSGAPVLEGVLAHVDCTVERVHEAGDHVIVVGRVQELNTGDGSGNDGSGAPLIFHRGAYARLD